MKKILFLILIIVLSGCVSRKSAVKENIKLNAVENVDKTEKETANHSSYDEAVKVVVSNTTDKTVTRTIETEYSAPGASGIQYKIAERIVEKRNDVAINNEENERKISELSTENERLLIDNSELRTKLNASLSEKTKTTASVPFWSFTLAFSIGIGIGLIVRKWIKTKFRY